MVNLSQMELFTQELTMAGLVDSWRAVSWLAKLAVEHRTTPNKLVKRCFRYPKRALGKKGATGLGYEWVGTDPHGYWLLKGE